MRRRMLCEGCSRSRLVEVSIGLCRECEQAEADVVRQDLEVALTADRIEELAKRLERVAHPAADDAAQALREMREALVDIRDCSGNLDDAKFVARRALHGDDHDQR